MQTDRIRQHFPSITKAKRICTNNAATTQIPQELLDLASELYLQYDNVHRGQSTASNWTTERFEEAYKRIAFFVGARNWRNVLLYRGTTEAINAIMYSLMTEFKNGDNVVTTYMEHNSNYVPWYALSHEIAPKFGINIECRLVEFDKESGELNLEDLEKKVDRRTKIICCTGASNFLGTKPPIDKIVNVGKQSGYLHPNGLCGSYVLVDGAQLVPHAPVDVEKMDVDFLAWSFHKMLAPVAVGGLYVRDQILETLRPFQYGGDMIAEGKVAPERVEYNELPWRFTAGTPNIIGTILAGEATRLIADLVLGDSYANPSDTEHTRKAMESIQEYERSLTQYLIDELASIQGVTVYGPKDASRRTSVVAFNIAGQNPMDVARQLDKKKIESRAGCHCATLAHHYLGIKPPASCRISPYFYNTMEEMEYVVAAVKKICSEPRLTRSQALEDAYKRVKAWTIHMRRKQTEKAMNPTQDASY
ncbi:MAG TPA: cysteine desulfurase [Candidatus Bathyarchaeia archaeon]